MIELLIVWIRPRADDVGKIFFCAPFGEEPLSELVPAHRDSDNLDIGIFFLEIRQHRLVTADVNRNLPFFLSGFERSVPFFLPIDFRRDRG